jgi:oxygen-independent coproporphyrinogen-3 oxidase
MCVNVESEIALLRRYRATAQQFGCYPGPERFRPNLNSGACLQQLQQPPVGGVAPALSLYVCGPRDKALAGCLGGAAVWSRPYLRSLGRELNLLAASVPAMRTVAGVFCRSDAVHAVQIIETIEDTFGLAADGERVMDTELCRLEPQQLSGLPRRGLKRLRIEAPGTCSACAATALEPLVQQARACGFQSVEIIATLAADQPLSRLAHMVEAAADRLIVPIVANLATPSRAEFDFVRTVMATLEAAGYLNFGMGYFVRRDDQLVHGRRRGDLGYNLRGFSLGANAVSLGLGPGSISEMHPYYSKNEATLIRYLAALDRHRLPVHSGIRLSADDQVRRAVIQALICHLEVPVESISSAYLIEFNSYFATELAQLQDFARAGALELSDEWLTITPRGRLLLPAMCAVFDAYRLRSAPS